VPQLLFSMFSKQEPDVEQQLVEPLVAVAHCLHQDFL
jgi:hypothetical protein